MGYHAASMGVKFVTKMFSFSSHRVGVKRASCPTTLTFVDTKSASFSARGTRDYQKRDVRL